MEKLPSVKARFDTVNQCDRQRDRRGNGRTELEQHKRRLHTVTKHFLGLLFWPSRHRHETTAVGVYPLHRNLRIGFVIIALVSLLVDRGPDPWISLASNPIAHHIRRTLWYRLPSVTAALTSLGQHTAVYPTSRGFFCWTLYLEQFACRSLQHHRERTF